VTKDELESAVKNKLPLEVRHMSGGWVDMYKRDPFKIDPKYIRIKPGTEEGKESVNYLIGQRVILSGQGGVKEIGKVVPSETGETSFGVWVFSPTKGYASDYSVTSVEPLPNGQL